MQLLRVNLGVVVRRIQQLAVADTVGNEIRETLYLGVFLAAANIRAPLRELIGAGC